MGIDEVNVLRGMIERVSEVPVQLDITTDGHVLVRFEGEPTDTYASFDKARKVLVDDGYFVTATANGFVVNTQEKFK